MPTTTIQIEIAGVMRNLEVTFQNESEINSIKDTDSGWTLAHLSKDTIYAIEDKLRSKNVQS